MDCFVLLFYPRASHHTPLDSGLFISASMLCSQSS